MSAALPVKGGRARHIPASQAVIVGANIRLLRQRKGWNQAKIGELMGWQSESTVCAAEGRRGRRQRGFTIAEVERLASIFDVPAHELTTGCANCSRHPPAGFACLACGARAYGPVHPRADAERDLRAIALLTAISEQLNQARRLFGTA